MASKSLDHMTTEEKIEHYKQKHLKKLDGDLAQRLALRKQNRDAPQSFPSPSVDQLTHSYEHAQSKATDKPPSGRLLPQTPANMPFMDNSDSSRSGSARSTPAPMAEMQISKQPTMSRQNSKSDTQKKIACAECKTTRRRCLHDGTGKYDPIKVAELDKCEDCWSKKQHCPHDEASKQAWVLRTQNSDKLVNSQNANPVVSRHDTLISAPKDYDSDDSDVPLAKRQFQKTSNSYSRTAKRSADVIDENDNVPLASRRRIDSSIAARPISEHQKPPLPTTDKLDDISKPKLKDTPKAAGRAAVPLGMRIPKSLRPENIVHPYSPSTSTNAPEALHAPKTAAPVFVKLVEPPQWVGRKTAAEKSRMKVSDRDLLVRLQKAREDITVAERNRDETSFNNIREHLHVLEHQDGLDETTIWESRLLRATEGLPKLFQLRRDGSVSPSISLQTQKVSTSSGVERISFQI